MKKRDIITEIKENNRNQFNPGFYTGGNMHPFYTSKPYKPKYVAIFWFVQSLLVLFVGIAFLYLVIIEETEVNLVEVLFIIVVLGIFFIIPFKCAKKYFNMSKSKKK